MPYKKKKDYNRYMRDYMILYRKKERELIQKARRELGLNTRVKKTQKRKRRKT